MVEIINYEVVTNKNKTIGYVDIKVPITKPTTLIFRRIAHLQNGDKKWFNQPSFGKEHNGALTYTKYYQFENEQHNAGLLQSLHDLVKDFCVKHGLGDQEVQLTFESPDEDVPF